MAGICRRTVNQNFPSLSSRTRNAETLGRRLGIRLRLNISVYTVSDSDSESKPQGIARKKMSVFMAFWGQNENQTRNSETLGSGLGIGLEIQTFKVSDSESGLEKQDSGKLCSQRLQTFAIPKELEWFVKVIKRVSRYNPWLNSTRESWTLA